MDRTILRDLALFEAVARHRSFTGAAAELAISQSTLSYAIGQLEERLGVALLARTTRRVAPTEAGRRLLQTLVPALSDIEGELATLQEFSRTIRGTVKLTMIPIAYDALIRPALPEFFATHPDVSVEVSINEGLNDLIAGDFDGGIRFSNLVEKDMVSIPLTRSSPAVIVGAPSYFARHDPAPRLPDDLRAHRCICYRYTSSKRLSTWKLEQAGHTVDFQAEGPLVLNDGDAIRKAAIDGLGLAYLFRSQVSEDIDSGRLVEVLADWLPDIAGFSLYYPSRRRVSSAFRALIGHVRQPAKD